MIDGFDNNPSARLEHAFHEIAAKSMAGLPFYRQHIPIRACGFQRFEGQWFGAILTPWMLQLMLLPGPGQRWQHRRADERVALALPQGEMLFRPGEIAPDLYYLACSLMSPIDASLSAELALELAESSAKLALSLPLRQRDEINAGRRALLSGKRASSSFE